MIGDIFYLLIFMSVVTFAMLIFEIIAKAIYRTYRKIRYIRFKNR